ncbi:MAG: peptidylprolyl isomerase, partial [Methanosarcinaceae archaeon]|nr:peptidylprolyl isomerase [Methanosarcinaceae archaeon]
LAKEIPLSVVDFKPEIGIQLMTDNGARGTVTSVGAENFVVDFNHELAGKTLIFRVTLVAVNEA